MKHTPGPWTIGDIQVYKSGFAPEVFSPDGKVVARVYAWGNPAKGGAALTEEEKDNRLQTGMANAKLVSVAPEALDSLLRVYELMCSTARKLPAPNCLLGTNIRNILERAGKL